MDDALVKKPSALATVAEHELPQSPRTAQGDNVHSEAESRSGSVVEMDNASASGSSSSEELLYVDESVAATKPPSDNVSGSTPFGRSAMLPPRAPVCPGDPDVEGVLPSQPSIVRRMQETNKSYVDPKDARALLPGVLFNSNSLDLDGVLDGMEAQNANRVQEKKLQEEVLLGLLRQRELESLYLAQQQRQQQELLLAVSNSGLDLELLTSALNEQCRVSPPGFPQQQFKQEPQPNNMLFQQMLNKPRHGRSVSDPTFAFANSLNSMPPPFQPPPQVDTAATTPVVDQSDALAFLNLPNFQQQPDWTAQDVQRSSLQPNLTSLFSMPNSMKPDVPKMDGTQKRRTHRHSKSVDLQNKARNAGSFSIKDRCPPLAPASGNKSTTRAEVKKMVQQQAALGRPTYAPWFRDKSNRNTKEPEMPMEMTPSHHRSQSLPQVYTAPGSPEKKQEPQQQPSSKGGRAAGTGVFLPRMPVSN